MNQTGVRIQVRALSQMPVNRAGKLLGRFFIMSEGKGRMKTNLTAGNDSRLLRSASQFFNESTLRGCAVVHDFNCDRRKACECRPRLLLRDGRVVTDATLREIGSRLG